MKLLKIIIIIDYKKKERKKYRSKKIIQTNKHTRKKDIFIKNNTK